MTPMRLVTLTGMGGIGKTQLAAEAVRRYRKANGDQAGEVIVDALLDSVYPNMSMAPGATADGLIVAVKSDSIELWDAGSGRMFEFHPPGPGLHAGVRADSVVLMSQDGPATIDLDRQNAFTRLCAISDRAHTPAELDGLPIGADSAAPCRS